jgi:leucine dehydrogenase
MSVFGAPDFLEHEQVVFVNEPDSGLRAIIAIHSTGRGPAFGGCRMLPYATEGEALRDVLRLSRAMTYKAAITRLPFGGGKTVVIGDPDRDKTPALLHALGRAIASLGGRYVTADDVGTTVRDMAVIREVTPFAAGLADAHGAPCPATAYGVLQGILAIAEHGFGRRDGGDLDGLSVAVQGLGSVGFRLCRYLHEAGARLLVSDVRPERVAEAEATFRAHPLAPDEILSAEADIVSPNALGAILDEDSIPRLRCRAIAGAANNQLAGDRHGAELLRRGILYAPDFVVNAGGLIDVAHEGPAYDPAAVLRDCERIRGITLEVFDRARHDAVPTDRMALRMAEENFRAGTGRIAA